MSIYSLLDDHIVGAITRSKGKELEKAREIIKRIKKRDMYPRIGEILDADSKNIPSDAVLKRHLMANSSLQPYCSEENLLVITHKYDYGMKDKNPLKYIFFYTKDDDNKGILLGDEKKEFNGSVHGIISLPQICVNVIDTLEFKRLTEIKQLGGANSVYPDATHNRLSHSIGVCYLAGKVIEHLKTNQPELKITDGEVKCVQLAGLCHDLGHGPFSHLFEKQVVKRLLPKGQKWKHEVASLKMLERLRKLNDVDLTQKELDFISDLIAGCPPNDLVEGERRKRYQERRFLFQIVANKDNGVDVDKWDYFKRDGLLLNISNSFDHERIIPDMKVCACERNGIPTLEICYRDKLVQDFSDMFATRWRLHENAYQHRVVKLVEEMYGDALCEFFKVEAKKESPEFGPITKVIEDMSIYIHLDDQIVGIISRSKEKELEKARKILNRIKTRDFYPCIGELKEADQVNLPKDDEIKRTLSSLKFSKPYCSEENLLIVTHSYDYGMGNENPLKHIFFYIKTDNKKGIYLGDEKMPSNLPTKLQLRKVRLYTREPLPVDKSERKTALEEIKCIKETVDEILVNLGTPTRENQGAKQGIDPSPAIMSNLNFDESSQEKDSQ